MTSVALIKGPKGSKVRLEILPAGKGAKTRIVTLTHERIRLEDRAVKMSVKTVGKEKSRRAGYSRPYVGLTDDVKVQLQKLEKQNVSSIIIDLAQQRRRSADRGGIALGSVYSVRSGGAGAG